MRIDILDGFMSRKESSRAIETVCFVLSLVQCMTKSLFPFLPLPLTQATLYHGSTWLYLTLLHSIMALLAVPYSTTLYHGSTWLYLTLLHSIMALLALPYSTTLYHGSSWLYLALLHSIMALLALLDSQLLLLW